MENGERFFARAGLRPRLATYGRTRSPTVAEIPGTLPATKSLAGKGVIRSRSRAASSRFLHHRLRRARGALRNVGAKIVALRTVVDVVRSLGIFSRDRHPHA